MASETLEQNRSREEALPEEIKRNEAELDDVEVENGDEEKEIEDSKNSEAEESKEKKTRRKRNSTSTPIERPSRERKIVERYVGPPLEKVSASKTLDIQQGRGVQLKDIPNVAFKLSKRKPDENLQMLHAILFGKRTKAHSLKRNINQFSGFVWVENEEKQRAKIKEKLDKCLRDKLLDFCNVLDIQISGTTRKKDELVVKLLEFLESPHATREVSLADKKKSKKSQKRKRKALASAGTASREATSGPKEQRKQISGTKKKLKYSSETDEEDEDESTDMEVDSDEDDIAERLQKDETDHGVQELEEEGSEKSQTESKKTSGSKKQIPEAISKVDDSSTNPGNSPAKSVKSSSSLVSEQGAEADDGVSGSPKTKKSASKKQDYEKNVKEDQNTSREIIKTNYEKHTKTAAKLSGKKRGKVSAILAESEPSRADMQAAVSLILTEVDFTTATISDILRQLGIKFGMDLDHRKEEVKIIIEEVIQTMADEEDEEGDEEDPVETAKKAVTGSEDEVVHDDA